MCCNGSSLAETILTGDLLPKERVTLSNQSEAFDVLEETDRMELALEDVGAGHWIGTLESAFGVRLNPLEQGTLANGRILPNEADDSMFALRTVLFSSCDFLSAPPRDCCQSFMSPCASSTQRERTQSGEHHSSHQR